MALFRGALTGILILPITIIAAYNFTQSAAQIHPTHSAEVVLPQQTDPQPVTVIFDTSRFLVIKNEEATQVWSRQKIDQVQYPQ